MRVLKAALVIMGVFILAGYAYLGFEVFKRFTKPDPAEPMEERVLPPVTVGGEVALGLPPGARIVEMLAASNRVVFRVTIPDGPDRLYLLDPRTGAVTPAVTTGKGGAP